MECKEPNIDRKVIGYCIKVVAYWNVKVAELDKFAGRIIIKVVAYWNVKKSTFTEFLEDLQLK